MRIKIQTQYKLVLGITFVLCMVSGLSFGQGCPTFKIKEVKNTTVDSPSGTVVVEIKGSKVYQTQNFTVRQKGNKVSGELGYAADIQISRDELVVSGLKKSEEMYLEEYVILFSDQSCNNNKVLEVGTFKIK